MTQRMNGKVVDDDSIFLGGIKPIQPKRRNVRIVLGLTLVLVAIALFLVGFLIGYFVKKPGNKPCSRATGDQSNDFEEFHKLFKEAISAERLESVVRYDRLMWYYYASSQSS